MKKPSLLVLALLPFNLLAQPSITFSSSTSAIRVYVSGESIERRNHFVEAPFTSSGALNERGGGEQRNDNEEYGWMVPMRDRLHLRASDLTMEFVGSSVWTDAEDASYSGSYPTTTAEPTSAISGTSIPSWLEERRSELENRTFCYDVAFASRGGNDLDNDNDEEYKSQLKELVVLLARGSSCRSDPIVFVTGHMPDDQRSGESDAAYVAMELQRYVTRSHAAVTELATEQPSVRVRFVDQYTPFLNNTATTAFPAEVWSTGSIPDYVKISRDGDGRHPRRLASIYAGELVADAFNLQELRALVGSSCTVTIDGPTSVCAGKSVTLDAGSGFSSYQWSTGTSTQTITVSPSATTTYTVTVATASGCQATSEGHTVTVSSAPSATISAPGSVVASSSGNAASVADAGSGASYLWTISGGTISGGSATRSITFSASASGSVVLNVSVTSVAGCNATGTTTIRITSTAGCTLSCSATVPSTASVGATISFTATTTASSCTGSPTVDWDFGDTSAHGTSASATHAYAAAGTYSWTLTVSVGATSCTKSGSVVVTPADTHGNQLILSNSRVLVDVDWRNPYSGEDGTAYALPQNDQMGFFYYSDPNNPEVFVKLLDFGAGSALCFVGGLTDFYYKVTFTMLRTGQVITFVKPPYQFIGFVDNSTLKFAGAPGTPTESSAAASVMTFVGALATGDVTATPKAAPIVSQKAAKTEPQAAAPQSLALSWGRVAMTVDWRNPYSGDTGRAYGIQKADQYGFFYYSDSNNPEVFVKVLDFGAGSALVFVGGLTDFYYKVTFKVLRTGQLLVFEKPEYQYIGFVDNNTLKF